MASDPEIIMSPDWKDVGKRPRDDALTTVNLSILQDLLDSQSNAASYLQLAYFSTSSIADVQNGIRDAAMRLWSADADAKTAMAHSALTANSVMDLMPKAFELLKSPETLTYAQNMFNQMASDAHKVQSSFTDVAAKYMNCSSMLSDNLNKGNLARAELQKKVEEAKEIVLSAQVHAKGNQEAVEAYGTQLADLKKQQEALDKKEDDVIQKQFTLELTKTILGGFSDLIGTALGVKHLAVACGTAAGNKSSSGLQSPNTSNRRVADDREVHVRHLAESTAKVKKLEEKLQQMGGAPAERKEEVAKELDKWKESVRVETIAVNEASCAIKEAGSAGDAGSEHSHTGWDLAKDIEERAKVVQERQQAAEARRAFAQKSVIKYQAQLAALAQQAQFDEPHLEQIKMALENLAKTSTSIHALAVFWRSFKTVLDTMASKSDDVSKPSFLGNLGAMGLVAFASVVNEMVAPWLIELYGYWWAVMDICNTYTEAASNVIEAASGKNKLYYWTQAAPGSDEMKHLLADAVEKAAAGKLIVDSPIMPPVKMISTAAA